MPHTGQPDASREAEFAARLGDAMREQMGLGPRAGRWRPRLTRAARRLLMRRQAPGP